MQKYIDKATLLTEARMMWTDYHCLCVIVEGETDIRFFNTLFHHCSDVYLRSVFGWENVQSIICKAEKDSYTKIAGVIDRDYHTVLDDGVCETSQLFFTDETDIEMTLFHSSAFEKFLRVCGSKNKLKTIGNAKNIVLTSAFPIGALRAISTKNNFYFDFDELNFKDIVDRKSLSTNVPQLIEKVWQRTCTKGQRIESTKEYVSEQLSEIVCSKSPNHYCNGHDVLDVICIAMQKVFATNDASTYNANSIYDYLLMGYHLEEFKETRLYKSLNFWYHAQKS